MLRINGLFLNKYIFDQIVHLVCSFIRSLHPAFLLLLTASFHREHRKNKHLKIIVQQYKRANPRCTAVTN